MLIKGATVVTDFGCECVDVRMSGELISEIGAALVPHDGETVIDATGKYLLPGGVDAHTHFDLLVGGQRASDSFASGSVAAACGGTTTIIDHMAFGPADAPLMHQVEAYHELADGKCCIDYGFHGVVDRVDAAVLAELPKLPEAGISSLKFYMTYDGRLSDVEIVPLLKRCAELGILPTVHCEDHDTVTQLRAQFVREGKLAAIYHPLSRPSAAEAKSVAHVLELAHEAGDETTDAPIYIVHTSSEAALDAATTYTAAIGSRHILETCPQYLVLDSDLYDQPNPEGLKYIMSPPLHSAKDREALWQALLDGRISTVATDHCPFMLEQKLLGVDDFTKCPGGAPGVELRLALMHSEGVVKRGMSLERMVELCSTAPARIFGIYPQKGTIAVGSDADLVIFDPQRKLRVTRDLLHEHVDYTPYEGIELCGYPEATISRGELIAQDGSYIGSQGRGKYLMRKVGQYPHS